MRILPDASSGFRIHKISFHGAAGAVVAVCLVAGLVEGVPALRWPFLFSLIAGCLLGFGLVLSSLVVTVQWGWMARMTQDLKDISTQALFDRALVAARTVRLLNTVTEASSR